MLRNYILTTIRIIRRSKIYTLINLIGLSIGIGIFIIVYLYLEFEYGYDKHLRGAENIYRVTTDMIWEQGPRQETAVTPGATAYFFKEEFPEIVASTRFIPEARSLIEVETKLEEPFKYYEDNVILADSTFFSVFDVPFHAGNKRTALASPNSVVISQELSIKLFGKTDSRGEILKLNNAHTYQVNAVMEDMPSNTHIPFSMVVSGLKYPMFREVTWRDLSFYTYVMIQSNSDISDLGSRFDQFYDKYFPQYKELMKFRMQKITDIHLKNDREFDRSITADEEKLKVLLIVALLVLILANFNFVNLSTAQATYRNKEIGVRKIVGAGKAEIILQLLSESFLLSFLSLCIVLFVIYNFSGQIKTFANIDYTFNPETHIPIFIGLTILTSLLSGIYPAVLISNFNPLRFLQSANPMKTGRSPLRSILIVFQFATTIALLISLSVIFHQMRYMKNMDLGFDKDQILTVPIWNDSTYQTTKRLKNALSVYEEFSNISVASFPPGEELFFEHFKPQGYESHVPLQYINVDPDYIPTLDIHIIEGRNFEPGNAGDKYSIIINEAAVQTFGWDLNQSLGKTIEYNFSRSWDDLIEGKVIGVMKDFNYGPLRNKIEPVILTMHLDFYPNLIIKINGNSIEQALGHLKEHYKQINNDYPLEYTFLDEKIDHQYKAEQYFSKVMIFFTLLAIVISALGLFGLSSFMMEKRIKEISIRKVHGASFTQLYFIFSGNFMKWISISLLFALPVAWYFSKEWLAGFAYRISLGTSHILFSLIIVILVVFCTISYHAFVVALKNPSKILKSE